MSQPIEQITPNWREAFYRWKSTNPCQSEQNAYLAGVCHALEFLGYSIETYDNILREVA